MAVLDVERITSSGLDPTLVPAASGGDEFPNDGRTFFIVNNGGASQITVTFVGQGYCSHGFQHDLEVTVDTGEELNVGPFSRQRFNDENGRVQVSYSDVTSVLVGAVRI